jgi:hypothetical protein
MLKLLDLCAVHNSLIYLLSPVTVALLWYYYDELKVNYAIFQSFQLYRSESIKLNAAGVVTYCTVVLAML